MKREAEVIKSAVPSMFTVAPIGRTNLLRRKVNDLSWELASLRNSWIHAIVCHTPQGHRQGSSSRKLEIKFDKYSVRYHVEAVAKAVTQA